jgi:hypothetical protein
MPFSAVTTNMGERLMLATKVPSLVLNPRMQPCRFSPNYLPNAANNELLQSKQRMSPLQTSWCISQTCRLTSEQELVRVFAALTRA